jgi:hypothetical protein
VTEKHEFIVVGSRGSHPPIPDDERRPDSILEIGVRDAMARHDAILDRINAMFPAARKVEVYATRDRPGWSVEPRVVEPRWRGGASILARLRPRFESPVSDGTP